MSVRRWVVGGVAALAAAPVAVALAAPGDLTRVSVKNDGSQSATGGIRGVTSGSGRYVAFVSAENLTDVSTGGKLQVFVRDRTDGKTLLASSTAAGVAANDDVDAGDAFNPFIDISADGRFVVFGTSATNLVDADTNAKADVFRKDMVTGEIVRLSVTTAGVQGDNDSADPSISGDGTRTVFRTAAANILPGVSTFGVALRDTETATTSLVSSNTAGVQANDFAERPTISADGTTAAFEAGPLTTNLYANDNNVTNDVIVKTLATGVAVPAAVVVGATTLAGTDVKGGNVPDLSGTGRYVVFQSAGVLDPVNDTNGAVDVYRRDLQTGTTTLVSARNALAGTGDSGATSAVISADGARAAFTSDATNLITGDLNTVVDVFVRTFDGLNTARLSERANATELPQGSETPGLAGNGGLGVFASTGAFAADDTNGAANDVYVKELTPTDSTPPVVAVTKGFTGIDGPEGWTFTGKVEPDPSGIASVRVAGALSARVSADGTFTGKYVGRIGSDFPNIPFVVTDGAGNRTSAVAEAFSNGPICCAPRPPAPAVTRKVTKVTLFRRKVRATIVTSGSVRAQIYLQRAIRIRGKLSYVRSGPIRSLSLKKGTTYVNLSRPKTKGYYRVRVAFGAGTTEGKAVTVTRGVTIGKYPR